MSFQIFQGMVTGAIISGILLLSGVSVAWGMLQIAGWLRIVGFLGSRHSSADEMRVRLHDKRPFIKKKLLTCNEVEFFQRLRRAVGDDYVLLAQTSMGALLDNGHTQDSRRYWELQRQYAAKIVDYVLCDAKTLQPLVLIELDDRSHNFRKDAERDRMTEMAGYKTLRFWSRRKPTVRELQARIFGAIGRRQAAPD